MSATYHVPVVDTIHRCFDVYCRLCIPATAYHSTSIGGANQDSIFIIGDSIYRFDTKTNAITAPLILGKVPPRRIDMSAVSYGA